MFFIQVHRRGEEGDELGGYGGPGRPGHPHLKGHDKQNIKTDIQ